MIRANRSERRGDQKARASLDDASCRVSGVAASFNNVARSTHKESKWVRQWLIVAGRTGAGFPAADSDGYRVPRSWECGGWCRYVLRTTYDTLAISLLSLSVCFILMVDLNWWMTQRILVLRRHFLTQLLRDIGLLDFKVIFVIFLFYSYSSLFHILILEGKVLGLGLRSEEGKTSAVVHSFYNSTYICLVFYNNYNLS